MYEIYGNFFYRNPREALLQATGRVSVHDNIFVDGEYTALDFQDNHDAKLKLANVYNNTIYTKGVGICFQTPAQKSSTVMGNIVFAKLPITGPIAHKLDNLIDDNLSHARQYLMWPTFVLGQMNLYPLPGKAQGPPLPLQEMSSDKDYNLDFNGTPKDQISGKPVFRGAYAGQGTNPGWKLQAGIKPEPSHGSR